MDFVSVVSLSPSRESAALAASATTAIRFFVVSASFVERLQMGRFDQKKIRSMFCFENPSNRRSVWFLSRLTGDWMMRDTSSRQKWFRIDAGASLTRNSCATFSITTMYYALRLDRSRRTIRAKCSAFRFVLWSHSSVRFGCGTWNRDSRLSSYSGCGNDCEKMRRNAATALRQFRTETAHIHWCRVQCFAIRSLFSFYFVCSPIVGR